MTTHLLNRLMPKYNATQRMTEITTTGAREGIGPTTKYQTNTTIA